MEKQLFTDYSNWKEDYGLTAEPEYQATQEYDFMKCFEAGYTVSQNEKKQASKIDYSTSLLQKLQQILFTHFDMKELSIEIGMYHDEFTVYIQFREGMNSDCLHALTGIASVITHERGHTVTQYMRGKPEKFLSEVVLILVQYK